VESDLHVTGNISYGTLTSPFWCAGKVDGSSLQVLSSKGQTGFTVEREPDFGAGVYKIIFDEAHPDGDEYVINITTLFTLSYLTPAPYATNGSSSFSLTQKTTSNGGLSDGDFHFTVLK
jgi:hypothetical protein